MFHALCCYSTLRLYTCVWERMIMSEICPCMTGRRLNNEWLAVWPVSWPLSDMRPSTGCKTRHCFSLAPLSITIISWACVPYLWHLRRAPNTMHRKSVISRSKAQIRLRRLCDKVSDKVHGQRLCYGLFPVFCHGLDSIRKTQTDLSWTCHEVCCNHLDMSE